MFNRIVSRRAQLGFAAILLAASIFQVAVAGPLGFVEANGTAFVYPAGTDTRLNVNGSQAIFADDRIELTSGSLILNLNGGGSFSFTGPAVATLGVAHGDQISVDLGQGGFSYSLPSGSRNLSVRAADMVVASNAYDLNADPGSVRSGAIERLASGELRTQARSGSLRVVDRDGTEHKVAAGEQLSIGDEGATKVISGDDEQDDDRRVDPAPRPQSIS